TMTRLGAGVTEIQLLTGPNSYLNDTPHRSTIGISHHLTGGEILEGDDTAMDGTIQVFLDKDVRIYHGSLVTEEGPIEIHYSHETGLKLL
ncbi:MAG: hypothetical protein ABEJ65_13050, partial [bacterium]